MISTAKESAPGPDGRADGVEQYTGDIWSRFMLLKLWKEEVFPSSLQPIRQCLCLTPQLRKTKAAS